MRTRATVVIVPGLRGPSPQHWQTELAAKLDRCVSVPLLPQAVLSCQQRVDNIQRTVETVAGPIIFVAHSAGCLMVAHWAQRYHRPIKGALLAAPPDLNGQWPDHYPAPSLLRAEGWAPLPLTPLPFPSIVAASDDDYLASLQASQQLAGSWASRLLRLGRVGHLNPASGYGSWPLAEQLIAELDGVDENP